MSEEKLTFEYCDNMVRKFEEVIEKPIVNGSSVYYTGVDLGTACVVLAVLDENYNPVAGAYRYADVVRDGMVVDYIGAVRIVRELKEEIEEKLNTVVVTPFDNDPTLQTKMDSLVDSNVVTIQYPAVSNAKAPELKTVLTKDVDVKPGTEAANSSGTFSIGFACGYNGVVWVIPFPVMPSLMAKQSLITAKL